MTAIDTPGLSIESYWAPVQVKLFAQTQDGAVWIDDAVGVDLRIEDQRVPHFGWRDRYFRDVSYGRSLVSGNLYIAYRHPNYLSDLFDNAGLRANSDFEEDPTDSFRLSKNDPIITAQQATTSSAFLVDVLRDGIDKYIAYAEQFKQAHFNGESLNKAGGETAYNGRVYRDIHPKRPAEVQADTGLRLHVQLRYGDVSYWEEPVYTRWIEDMVLTSEAHTITMLDGQGDHHLIEVYSFFARNVRTR